MSNAAKLLATATAHHQAGRLLDAEKAYHKLLRSTAAEPDALRLLGGLYLQRGQWPEAAHYLEQAVRLRPHDAETLTNCAIAWAKGGRSQEAEDLYKRSLLLRSDDKMTLRNLGLLYQETGQTDKALPHLERVCHMHPNDPLAHLQYGNVLTSLGRLSEAGVCYEKAVALKPDYVDAMINLGLILGQAGKPDIARQWFEVARTWFEKALVADPNDTRAMNNMANILRQLSRPDEAEIMYRRALALRPDYVEAILNLVLSLRDQGKTEEAMSLSSKVVELKPHWATAHINMGTLYQDAGQHTEACAAFEEALKYNPSSIDAKWNTSLSLLAQGNLREGFALHEVGLGVAHMRGEHPTSDQRWRGEPFGGKTLVLWSEQGFGDTLQFIRYAALCKERSGQSGRVHVLCPLPLRSLLANCPFIDRMIDRADETPYDFHAPLMSLPYIFGTELTTIPNSVPYLFVSHALQEKWQKKMAELSAGRPGAKIGLVWAGNPRPHLMGAHLIDKRRSMSLQQLRPLFDKEGIVFCNLQMGESAVHQIDECGLRDCFIDPMPDVTTFEDSAAIIQNLDLVITVDTSVAHLAGGLGKPVWIMSRFDACWRWLQNRPENPWYPTARVFGQPSAGNWRAVVDKIKAQLHTT